MPRRLARRVERAMLREAPVPGRWAVGQKRAGRTQGQRAQNRRFGYWFGFGFEPLVLVGVDGKLDWFGDLKPWFL